MFTEPALAFSVGGYSDGATTIHVYLSLEAAPPSPAGIRAGMYEHFVVITISAADLLEEIDRWEHELTAFPPR